MFTTGRLVAFPIYDPRDFRYHLSLCISLLLAVYHHSSLYITSPQKATPSNPAPHDVPNKVLFQISAYSSLVRHAQILRVRVKLLTEVKCYGIVLKTTSARAKFDSVI